MTNPTENLNQPSGSGPQDPRGYGYPCGSPHGDPLWWAKTPGFHPLKAVAVIAGFAIFPPLGVAALVYFIWNARRSRWDHGPYAFASAGGPDAMRGGPGGRCGRGMGRRGRGTGNSAFDEHQAGVLDELAKEREDFAAAREDERRKRDREAFEAFKAGRASKPDAGGSTPPATTL